MHVISSPHSTSVTQTIRPAADTGVLLMATLPSDERLMLAKTASTMPASQDEAIFT